MSPLNTILPSPRGDYPDAPVALASSRESADPRPPPREADHTADLLLMEAIQAGDEAALTELMARHRFLLRGLVAQVLCGEADVEETLQDVLLEVWRCAANFDPTRGKPLGWIVRMTRRRAIDRLRKNLARQRLSCRLEAQEQTSERALGTGARPVDQGEFPAGLRDLRSFLDRLTGTLPSGQREALELNFYGQLSQREIARHTGLPLGTIKTRLELALKKLSQMVSAQEKMALR